MLCIMFNIPYLEVQSSYNQATTVAIIHLYTWLIVTVLRGYNYLDLEVEGRTPKVVSLGRVPQSSPKTARIWPYIFSKRPLKRAPRAPKPRGTTPRRVPPRTHTTKFYTAGYLEPQVLDMYVYTVYTYTHMYPRAALSEAIVEHFFFSILEHQFQQEVRRPATEEVTESQGVPRGFPRKALGSL